MPDEIDTLGSLVSEVRRARDLSQYSPALLGSDTTGYLRLAERWTSTPAAHTPLRLPDEATLDALIAQLFPPRIAGGLDIAAVTATLEAAIVGVADINASLNAMSQGDWSEMFEVARRLAVRGPTIDGQTYLEILEGKLRTFPNVDQRVVLVILAGVLAGSGRTVATDPVAAWVRLADLLLVADTPGQMAVLDHFGVPADAAEDVLALFFSEAAEAGLLPTQIRRQDGGPDLFAIAPPAVSDADGVPPPWLNRLDQLWSGINRNAQSFLDWTKPADEFYGRYIGIQVHLAIAAYYRSEHAPHLTWDTGTAKSARVWTNSTPVMTILGALQSMFAFQGSTIKRALAVSRPDIFEFGFVHGMPPGYVYEIKPASGGAGAARAAAEARFYAIALSLCDIPAQPGPVKAVGVDGVVPTAGGWAAFVCPFPGVIVYRYRQASKEALAQRATVPVNAAMRLRTEDWVRASGHAAAVAKVGLIAAILAALAAFTLLAPIP